jgi:hypothetical protein
VKSRRQLNYLSSREVVNELDILLARERAGVGWRRQFRVDETANELLDCKTHLENDYSTSVLTEGLRHYPSVVIIVPKEDVKAVEQTSILSYRFRSIISSHIQTIADGAR